MEVKVDVIRKDYLFYGWAAACNNAAFFLSPLLFLWESTCLACFWFGAMC